MLGFAGVAALALVLQYLLFARILSDVAAGLPDDGNLMIEVAADKLLAALAISFVVLLPATLWIGIQSTHRIAGPLHRIEQFLRDVREGRARAQCELRRGDELQELCDLANQVTERQRAELATPRALEPTSASSERAA